MDSNFGEAVSGDKVLPTESTGMMNVPSMPLHMSLYVVLGDAHLPHRAQCYEFSQGQHLCVLSGDF